MGRGIAGYMDGVFEFGLGWRFLSFLLFSFFGTYFDPNSVGREKSLLLK
jgi:hypothetical protein